MTVYTYESSSFEELAGTTYITIIATNNTTNLREKLAIKYYDYCFIEDSIADTINEKYLKTIIKGYTLYQNNKKCSKVIFNCRTEMLKILTDLKVDGNLIYLRPDKKFMIEKKILYKFVVNTKDKPIPHNKIFGVQSDEVDIQRIIYADIEVDSEGDLKFPTGENAIHPVISISYVTWENELIWTCFDPDQKEEIKKYKWKTKYSIKKLNNLPVKLLNDLPVKVIIFNKEIELLKFVGAIQSAYDSYILTGWNFLRFDMYYLIGRCKKLNISPSVLTSNGWIRHKKHYDADGRDVVKVWTTESYIIDSMEAFIRFWPDNLRHNSLDYVAQKILGNNFGKVKSKKSISELYKTDKKSLMNYNVIDSLLIKLINEKIGMFKFYELRRKMRGITISDVFKTIAPIESALLYFADKYKIALPDTRIQEKTEQLRGALVYTDVLQIVSFAGMFDFKAEYASIAASLNCSSNTLVTDKKLYIKLVDAYKKYKLSDYKQKPTILNNYTYSPGIGEPIFFENKKDCFEKKFLLDRFNLREYYFNLKHEHIIDSDEYKLLDIYEQDVKLDGNGLYGAWSNKYFKLSNIKCAQAITGIGRELLDYIRQYLDTINEKVVLSDTDSADTDLKAKTLKEAIKNGYRIEKIISDELNSYVQKRFLFGKKNGYIEGFDLNKENTDTHWIFAKFEKIFAPMIITGKMKHYAYKQVWQDGKILKKPKYKVKGFECVQRNVSPILKDAQEKLIYGILDKKITDSQATINFIKSYKNKLNENNLELLPMTGGYKSKITDYKNVERGYLPPIHAQAMCNSIANFNIQFEPLSRFKMMKIIRIKSGKYDKKILFMNGINVNFQQKHVGYNDLDELPNDFFTYFKPDYEHYYQDLIIDKNEIFLELMNVNKIVFTDQKQLTDYT